MADEKNNLICSHCGATEPPIQKEGIWRCKYCGIKRPSPYDLTDDICIELNMANNLRLNKHFGDALEIYERILEKDKNLEEANWGALVSEYGIEFVEDHGDFVPTVHRVNKNSVQKMPYYAKLSEEYRARADRIETVRSSVWQKVEKIPPYDVFICYKETDDKTESPTPESKWARDLYYNLTHKFGLKVFYAPESLPKSNAEYEPHIYAALQSAKLMVVLASKKEYVEAPWVKNEWSRFAKFAKKDTKEKIIRVMLSGIDTAALPAELRNRQVFDRDGMWEDSFFASVGELFNSVPQIQRKSYAATKVGTKQGVKQAINKRTFSTYTGTASISEATEIENAKKLALELEKFDLAVRMCANILAKNRACHDAYFIKLLAENRCKTREEFLLAKGIANIKTLEDAIATGDSYAQQVILRTVHDKIRNTKDFGLYKEYITFPGVREPDIADLTEMFLEDAISRCDTAMFDEAIKAVASLDKYLKMHHGIIRALKEKGAKKNSQKIWQYLRAVLDHDVGNNEVLWEAYCMERGLHDKAAIRKHCLALGSYEELEKLYEYGYNAYVSEALLAVCLEGAEKQTAASVTLFDFLLKLIPEKANELFDRNLRKFIEVLFKYGKFDEVSKYNDQLIAMDKYDHTAYFNRVLIKYKTNNLLFFLSMYDELLLDEDFSAAIETYGVRHDNQENRYRKYYVQLGEILEEIKPFAFHGEHKYIIPFVLKSCLWQINDIGRSPLEKIVDILEQRKIRRKKTLSTIAKTIIVIVFCLVVVVLVAFLILFIIELMRAVVESVVKIIGAILGFAMLCAFVSGRAGKK